MSIIKAKWSPLPYYVLNPGLRTEVIDVCINSEHPTPLPLKPKAPSYKIIFGHKFKGLLALELSCTTKIVLVALVTLFVMKCFTYKLLTSTEKKGDHMETNTCALSVLETLWAIGTEVVAATVAP